MPALYTLIDDLRTRLFSAKRQPWEAIEHEPLDFGSVYLVRAALPGVKHQDVDVSIHAHALTIRGKRGSNGQTDGTWVVREYGADNWERSMALPEEVESAGVTASYADGILELRLPKAEASAWRSVPITGPHDDEHPNPGPPPG